MPVAAEVQAIKRRAVWAGLVGALCASPGLVRANGAFPDSQSVLTPADRPNEIILATNFGLVISEDGGQSWGWACETTDNAYGVLYQFSPAPRHRLFVLANDALAYSDDGTCGWQQAAGSLAGQQVADAFPDPTNADRVLAVGVSSVGGPEGVYPSMDGGATFGAAIYMRPAGDTVNGVESAQSDPQVIYVAASKGLSAPVLARSADAGAHWTETDLSSTLGAGTLRIVSVDPQDPNRVVLRFSGANNETLALTVDGGATVSTPLMVSGQLNAFARLPSGTLLAGAMVSGGPAGSTGTLYRSRDGGMTFDVVASAPSVRALSVRSGVLYAAADNFGNGYAVGTSTDEGDTWHALMSYADVAGIVPCLKAACQSTCATEVTTGLWTDAVCSADITAGAGGADGGVGPGSDGGGGSAATGAGGGGGSAPPKASGGGCRSAGEGASGPLAVALLALLWWASRARSRRA